MKNSFVLYTEYAEHLQLLTMEERGILITAIMNYETGNELPEMSPAISMAFSFIRTQLDRDRQRYEDTVAKRSAAGSASGEARRNKSEHEGTKRTSVHSVQQKETNANTREQEGTKRTVNVDVDEDVDVNDKKIKRARAREEALASCSEEVRKEIEFFIEQRKKQRRPMSDHAVELFVKRLYENSKTDAERIELIQTAIERGWMTIYPKDDIKKKDASKSKNRFNNFEQRDYDYDDLEATLLGFGGDSG